jgi:hypothetical protein
VQIFGLTLEFTEKRKSAGERCSKTFFPITNSKKKVVRTEMFAGDKNEYGGGSCAS